MAHLSLLIKPASGLCNLRCRYCFYADEMCRRETPSYGIMTEETLSLVLEKTFAWADSDVTFAFQGGEPTLAGLEFFRKVVERAEKYNVCHLPVHYALQTNGMALDEEWAAFLGKHRFLVGISLDGDREIHNCNRVSPGGEGSFDTVMERISLLKAHQVEFNILTVVTGLTAGSIGRIYRFFQKNDLPYQQYIPCLDPLEGERGGQAYSLTPAQYGEFLKTLFDLWYGELERGRYWSIRYFDNLLWMLDGHAPEQCSMVGCCGPQYLVEADGSVYPCDFFVLDQWRLGTLGRTPLAEMAAGDLLQAFFQKGSEKPAECAGCRWRRLCGGGCKNDWIQTADGSHNYYCKAFRMLLDYAMPRMQRIAQAERMAAVQRMNGYR